MRWVLALAALAGCSREAPPPKSEPPRAALPAKPSTPRPSRPASVVKVLCRNQEGAGFWVAPDRVVTLLRQACPEAQVRLHDGRTLPATIKAQQPRLDLAELEVAGGEGEPLALGNSLGLKETDDVFLPNGATGTVRAAFASRLGVPHLEVAFERSAAPGDAVLDASGRLVGLVAVGSWVLPIEALGPSPRWAEVEQRAKQAIVLEVSQLRRALGRPFLAAALLAPDGRAHAVVLSRTETVVVRLEGCPKEVPVAWEPFRMEAWHDPATRELFRFIDQHDLDIGLKMSTVVAPCGATATLKLEGAELPSGPMPVVETSLAVVDTPAAPPPRPAPVHAAETAAPALQESPAPSPERVWRSRFEALHSEREHFEREVREKQRFLEAADRLALRPFGRPDQVSPLTYEDRLRYETYKRELEDVERQRGEFQRKLDDLEREASHAAVPREWRR